MFEFDPPDGMDHTSPGLSRIDTTDDARDRDRVKRVPIRIDYDICDDAGACILVCPENVIERVNNISTVVRGQACTECWICVENCSSSAIEMM